MFVARKNYLEWKRQATVFSEMAALRENQLNESGVDHPRHVSTGYVSPNLFPMLGARPLFGRLFTPDEERNGSDRVVILSDTYFEARFHRDPAAAIGKSVALAGVSYTVIGVLPPNFHLPATWEGMDQKKPEVWVPLSRLWNVPQDDGFRQLIVMARLKPNVSLTQARAEMKGIASRLSQADPELNSNTSATVFPFSVEDTAPQLRRALYVLLAAAGFLLLIACANLANLTIARTSQRSRDVAVRLALGATRRQIVGQLLAESLTISLMGAAVGMLVAHWCIQGMLALKPNEIQRAELIRLNFSVFLFAAAASVCTALLFGLTPAISAARADLNSALKTGSGGASAARLRSRQFLIAAEVALAVILLSGAGVMIRSFRQLIAIGIGFSTAHLTGIDVDLPEVRYPDGAAQSRFFRRLIERARAIPGVAAVSVVDRLPLHSVMFANFLIEGRPDPPKGSMPLSDRAQSSPEYFSTIGLPLRAGRFFTDTDLARNEQDKNGVVIVNESFAAKFFHGENPIGKGLQDINRKFRYEIIGVVADYRPMGVENGARPQIFSAYLKVNSATLLVRTRGDPEPLSNQIRNAIWSIDKDLPADKVETMESHLDEWQSQRKFNTLLLAIFAGLALVLAMIGVYGVLANLVAARTREIGIRVAIGATPVGIGKLVVAQSMIPVGIGLALGIAGSLALSRVLQSLLFQVPARDPFTLGMTVAAILLLSPFAIYVPLRRAIRVDCTVALREE